MDTGGTHQGTGAANHKGKEKKSKETNNQTRVEQEVKRHEESVYKVKQEVPNY